MRLLTNNLLFSKKCDIFCLKSIHTIFISLYDIINIREDKYFIGVNKYVEYITH